MSVSEEIIKVLDALAEKFGIAVDWTSENVFPYLQTLCDKFVRYELVTSIIGLVFGVIVAVMSVFAFRGIFKFYKKYEENYADMYAVFVGICVVACVICGIVALIAIPMDTFDIIKCLTFPEKVIFDEIKSLLTAN